MSKQLLFRYILTTQWLNEAYTKSLPKKMPFRMSQKQENWFRFINFPFLEFHFEKHFHFLFNKVEQEYLLKDIFVDIFFFLYWVIFVSGIFVLGHFVLRKLCPLHTFSFGHFVLRTLCPFNILSSGNFFHRKLYPQENLSSGPFFLRTLCPLATLSFGHFCPMDTFVLWPLWPLYTLF